jgi:hypothetical protein
MSVILGYIMHKTSPATNKVMRSYVSVIAATEVVLLLKSGRNEVRPAMNYGRPKNSFLPDFLNKTTSAGRNEVCPAINYGRPKNLFSPDFPNKTTSAGENEVCLYTDYITFMEGNSKFQTV